MRSDTIVAYTYNAANYCPLCIVAQLPTGEGERFDGWKLADGITMTTEDNLSEIAAAFEIDRMDERSFDSDEFPKVVFADQVEDDDEVCESCGESFLGGW